MELIQEGMVGLLEAAESYDYKRQVAFSLFASYRIRGSMVDYLRHSTDKGMLDRPAQAVADAIDVSLGHVYRLQKQGVRRIRGMLSRFIHEFNKE